MRSGLAWWAIAAAAIGCSGGGKGGGSQGPALVSIAIAPAGPTTIVGGTVAFHATGAYADGTTRDATADATWTSTNAATATVSDAAGAKGLATAIATGTTTVRAAIGAVAGETGLTVVAATVVSIRIDPSAAVVGVGATAPLRCLGATGVPGAQEVDLTGLAAWTSDHPDVASVTGGVATGVKAGTAQIAAAYAGFTAQATVAVETAVLQGLALTLPAGARIALGAEARVDAVASYSDGSTRTVTSVAAFSSSAPGVLAFVAGSAGLYDAVGLGTATVTGAYGGQTASVTVSVVANEIVALAIDPSPALLPAGDALPYRANALRLDGSAEDVTAAATWTTDAPQVATAVAGVVTAVGVGSAVVHASYGRLTAATVVEVPGSAVNQLSLASTSVSLVVGGTSSFGGTVWFAGPVAGSPSYSEPAADVVRVAIADPTVVELRRRADGSLYYAGLAPGTTTVTFGAGGITQPVTVQVVAGALTLSVPATFVAGVAAPIGATTVSGGLRGYVSTLATWSTDAPAVAEVASDARGHPSLVAHAPGTVHVTASFAGASATATVTVVPVPTSIEVTPSSFQLAPRASQTLAVIGHLPSGDVSLTAVASWLVEDPDVGSLYGASFTGARAGATSIVASVGGLTARASAVVWPELPMSIAILPLLASGAPGPYTLPTGATATFSASPFYPYAGGGIPAPIAIAWTTADPTVAAFSTDPSKPGQLTAVAAGTTTLTATYAHPSGAKVTAQATVRVAPLLGIAATQPGASVMPAQAKTLSVTGTFDDGTGAGTTFTGDVTPWVAWTSSAPDVARPYRVMSWMPVPTTAPGVLGVSPGSAVLTGTLGTASCDVAVIGLPPAISSLAISYESPGVVGFSFSPTASAVIVPNAFEVDVTSVATWAGDGSVLGVSGTPPVVQLLSAGSAPVTATLGGVTGSTSVYVVSESYYALVPAERRLTLAPGSAASFDLREYRQSYAGFDVGAQSAVVSSNAAVATAVPTSNGISVQAHAPGEAILTVSYGGIDERVAVNVFDAPGDLSLWSGAGAAIHVHQLASFSVQDSVSALGLSFSANGAVTWTSSDPTTVKVDGPGLVEGVKPGRAVITASTPTFTASVPVTVSDATLVSVSPSALALPLPVGAAVPLRAFARYSDGARADVTHAVAWWSAAPAAAAFDASQPSSVRALAAGITRVECRLDGLSGYAMVTGF